MSKLNINKLRTTKLGAERIKRNLRLDIDDVIDWCKQAMAGIGDEAITRKGKNWYVAGEWFVLTINASSHTIITAHKKDREAL
jgi:hypothetical protein